jgi:hypothetical protein
VSDDLGEPFEDFTQDAKGKWVCSHCGFAFGRRSAHTPNGDRCAAFTAGRLMRERDFEIVQHDVAIWMSKNAPMLITYKKAIFRPNEPVKSYAWAPMWAIKLYEAYRLRMLGSSSSRFASFISAGEPNAEHDVALDERARDSKDLLRMLDLVRVSPDLQAAILAVANLDEEEGNAVWLMLVQMLDGVFK